MSPLLEDMVAVAEADVRRAMRLFGDGKFRDVLTMCARPPFPMTADLASIWPDRHLRDGKRVAATAVAGVNRKIVHRLGLQILRAECGRYRLTVAPRDRQPRGDVAGARVATCMQGYHVIDAAGRPISGTFSQRTLAEARLDAMRRAASKRTRTCMCCPKTFQSEGPHNRLCPSCSATGNTQTWMGGAA